MQLSHRHTIRAGYIGYITQAIVNNLAPLLFLIFRAEFGLSLEQITFVTTVNFAVQLGVDFLSTFLADRIGYRPCVVAAHVLSALGLVGMGILPGLTAEPYVGLMTAVVLYAVGGGLIEVLISPIVESCPTEGKEAAMSLLHSFYCWGHAAVVLLSTLFLACFGAARWRLLCFLWALVPMGNILYFCLVPLYPVVQEGQKMPARRLLGSGLFWLLMLLMVCAGASEQAMSQWSSAFAEAGLHVSKTVGDLAGPYAFALAMGTARALYGRFADRLPLIPCMAGCTVLCALCYLLASLAPLPGLALLGCALCGFSVGVFWPGTFSVAARVLPGGGTVMYALMALAGDVGCSGGPTLVGLLADARGGALSQGLIFGVVFPLTLLLGLALLKRRAPSGR